CRLKSISRKLEQAKIFFGGENLLCFRLKAGSGDALYEKLGDFFRGGRVHLTIEGKNSAEGGNGIRRKSFKIGIAQRGLLGGSAGIVVFDDDRRGIFEFCGETTRGFEVHQIVVGKFFSLELLRSGKPIRSFSSRNVKRRGLVRIFS